MEQNKNSSKRLKLYSSRIPAGFPSPADDFLEKELDLNELLVRNPAATFLVRVRGESMKNAGIFDGDIIVVDRTVEPDDGKVVLGVLNGEFTVKRIDKKNGRLFLMPENPKFDPIEINEAMEFHVWGVVTYCLHRL
jgi:DNA polymerase V